MENKKYYWLRLKDNFFIDKRIKKLRKIAGGDTYTIIYLKMQLLSLQDEGNLYFENIEETFEEEIALQIDEEYDDVKLTIAYLLNCGLLNQISENTYELIETKNCIGSETRNAESMRKLREKRKENVTMLQNVTKCYTEKEKEIEIEIEKEQEDIYSFIEENFGRTLSPIEYEQISQWEDNELTRYAIKQAVLNGKYNLKYVNAILNSWKKNCITSVQEAQQETNKFKETTQVKNVPEWFGKEIEQELVSNQEEQNFLEKLKKARGQ